ncbi:GmrSD restriction endonuclease domain-containing protein [Streptomyces niveus]|uniref:GmrSD restriction endonuclease domain-containing protein n=1 Tax=Streptomyces niveus TaxID=193462 RepID=UPI00343E838E
MQENLIQGKAMTIEEVFTGRRYRLDTYQRDYSWARDDVRRLLDDLQKKFMANWRFDHDREAVAMYQPYFLGPYVYHDAAPVTYLVDGQQRITTLHLMLIYLRQLLRAQDQDDQAAKLNNLIQSHKFGTSVYTLDIPDRDQLLKHVFEVDDYALPDNASGALRRLWEAAQVYREEFPEDLRGDALPYFVDWLLDGVCMVGIRASSQEQGWEIYESMNDRGVRLGPIDLLKSHLLSNISEPTGADITWRQMVSQLASIDVNAPGDFIKTFLVARYADVSETSSDVERINGLFHTWVKDNAVRIGLHKPSDHSNFIQDLVKYADFYRTLASAARTYRPELKGLFLNAYNGITAQTAPILAAVEPQDSSATFKLKANLIANYLEVIFARRLVNDLPSSGGHLDREAVRLTGLLRGGVSVDGLRVILAEEIAALEYDFTGMTTYGLRSNNTRQVRYLLARLTGFVETACGGADEMDKYLDAQRPFEIEHIWSNHFDRYQPETNTRASFDSYRNRLGALLLLPKSDNASYQDLPYERKVEYYQRRNKLAGSLHSTYRERNPSFNSFIKTHRLDAHFRSFPKFNKDAIGKRQVLYRRLCDLIWSPAAFGTTSATATTGRADKSRARTRARYDVAVTDLIAKGLIPAGAKLIGRRRGEKFEASIVDQGRIKVASGEVFGSLSAAGEFVLQTKSCPGWNFWHAQLGDREVRLINIRREALEKGIL